MPTSEIRDRSNRLFGRTPDLQRLKSRADRTGLTAVVARPQMGKSWLLVELARLLSKDCLVGLTESFGETSDLMLRAIVDLYQRWLTDLTYWKQARLVWEQQHDKLLPALGGAFGSIARDLLGLVTPAAAVVKEALEGLLATNETLKTGGVKVPRLLYEQARDLVKSVSDVSERPICLFLDQWEKSQDAGFEAKTLDAFLSHLEDWPPCHIFLALREEEGDALRAVKDLAQAYPAAEVYQLGEMALSDQSEEARLIAFLRRCIPAAVTLDDQTIVNLVAGYPGVIYRWMTEGRPDQIKTVGDLTRVAHDAQNYRFRELEELLNGLQGDQRKMAIRIALVPSIASQDTWQALRKAIIGEITEEVFDDLHNSGVLEVADPPAFGHSKRSETALDLLVEHRRNALSAEGKALVLRLAQSIPRIDSSYIAAIQALASLSRYCRRLNWGSSLTALCDASSGLLGESAPDLQTMRDGSREARASGLRDVGALLAVGLLNALIDSKREEKLERRDQLLDELRALAGHYADDAVVREQLAMGLLNTLNNSKQEEKLERRDQLLDELRALAGQSPDDAAVREQLVMGLFNTLNYCKEEEKLERRDRLLDELRTLAGHYADDAAVRKQLAGGLFNTLNDCKEEEKLERRDQLLDELRALADHYADDAAVREGLAGGLLNTLNDCKEEEKLERRDQLLDELRALADHYADDAAVRKQLAGGLFNTLNDCKEEEKLERRDQLLDELRTLAGQYPDDAAVREQLVMGLFNTLNDCKEEEKLERRDQLLDELRALAGQYPDDAAVREQLAGGLLNTLSYCKEEEKLERRDQLLDELRALADHYPDDAAVRSFIDLVEREGLA